MRVPSLGGPLLTANFFSEPGDPGRKALQGTDMNLQDYGNFIDELRKITGEDAIEADESGLASVRVDDHYTLHLQFVPENGKILCFIQVAVVPDQAPARLYRELLCAGLFGQETAGGYFAMENQTGAVIYNYLFDGEQAASDAEEFVQTLEKILQLCDLWLDRINEILGSDSDEEPAVSSVTLSNIVP